MAAGLAGRQNRAVQRNRSKLNSDEARIAIVSLNDHRKKTLLEHAGMLSPLPAKRSPAMKDNLGTEALRCTILVTWKFWRIA